MEEYIEREALMFNIAAKFEKHYGKSREQSIHDFYKFVIKKICAAPVADVVPVVRCGNCRNRYEKNWAKCQGRRPDEFCSDGVSRFKE